MEEIFNKWNKQMLHEIDSLVSQNKAGKSFKDEMVFFMRSPLSPLLSDPSPPEERKKKCFEALEELRHKTEGHFSLLICHPEPMKQILRTSGRLFDDEEAERKEQAEVRKLLKETNEEYISSQRERYANFARESPHIVDHVPETITLPTTSAKQAVANLLSTLGVKKPQFPPIFQQ